MKKLLVGFSMVTILAITSANAQVNLSDISVGGDIGTTGIGVIGVKKLNDQWGLRVGFHKYSYSKVINDDDVKYDFDLDLQDFQIMADYYPWKTSFKLTGGILVNGIELDGKISPNNGVNFEFGGNTYTTADISTANTTVDFDRALAPYLGLGWDTAFYKKGWGFAFNAGVIFAGSATVDYSVDYTAAAQAAPGFATLKSDVERDLAIEKASLEDDLDSLKYMPYISLGFNYKF